ncbi:hypothetical protein BZL43_26500 [Pseudomonas sp. PICF141]|nr:hypothetical protein BZL43_26500 [Pseudomonas sp. PICF141]
MARELACGDGICLWRGGLPVARGLAPVGPRSGPGFCQIHRIGGFTTAAQPNGGKPSRHKKPALKKTPLRKSSLIRVVRPLAGAPADPLQGKPPRHMRSNPLP